MTPSTGPVLTTRQLNRSILARQLLLDRSDAQIPDALEQVAGLQTQYAPSGYIGLWSRLRRFERADLDAALEDRRVVHGTLMRSTIHMVSARDYWLFATGSRPGRRAWWERVRRSDLQGVDMTEVVACVRDALSERPRRHREMVDLLAARGFPPVAWQGAGEWLDLVRLPPSGTWARRRADLYGLAEDWLGSGERISETEGLRHLARCYLAGFGPASITDMASWAGLPVATLRPAIDDLDLRPYRSDQGAELLDLPEAVVPDPDTPAPPRFLGTWEATLLVHARRALVLAEEHRPLIFATKNPKSSPTFLVDGAVAGTWRYVEGQIAIEPFTPLNGGVRRQVDEEAERLAAFHAD